jgi:hypothetical protein
LGNLEVKWVIVEVIKEVIKQVIKEVIKEVMKEVSGGEWRGLSRGVRVCE